MEESSGISEVAAPQPRPTVISSTRLTTVAEEELLLVWLGDVFAEELEIPALSCCAHLFIKLAARISDRARIEISKHTPSENQWNVLLAALKLTDMDKKFLFKKNDSANNKWSQVVNCLAHLNELAVASASFVGPYMRTSPAKPVTRRRSVFNEQIQKFRAKPKKTLAYAGEQAAARQRRLNSLPSLSPTNLEPPAGQGGQGSQLTIEVTGTSATDVGAEAVTPRSISRSRSPFGARTLPLSLTKGMAILAASTSPKASASASATPTPHDSLRRQSHSYHATSATHTQRGSTSWSSIGTIHESTSTSTSTTRPRGHTMPRSGVSPMAKLAPLAAETSGTKRRSTSDPPAYTETTTHREKARNSLPSIPSTQSLSPINVFLTRHDHSPKSPKSPRSPKHFPISPMTKRGSAPPGRPYRESMSESLTSIQSSRALSPTSAALTRHAHSPKSPRSPKSPKSPRSPKHFPLSPISKRGSAPPGRPPLSALARRQNSPGGSSVRLHASTSLRPGAPPLPPPRRPDRRPSSPNLPTPSSYRPSSPNLPIPSPRRPSSPNPRRNSRSSSPTPATSRSPRSMSLPHSSSPPPLPPLKLFVSRSPSPNARPLIRPRSRSPAKVASSPRSSFRRTTPLSPPSQDAGVMLSAAYRAAQTA